MFSRAIEFHISDFINRSTPLFESDLQSLWKLVWNVFHVAANALTFLRLCACSPASVAAENLFLRNARDGASREPPPVSIALPRANLQSVQSAAAVSFSSGFS